MITVCHYTHAVLISRKQNGLFYIVGTNEDAIIHVIANRTNAQRQKIKKKFKTAYGEVKSLFSVLN